MRYGCRECLGLVARDTSICPHCSAVLCGIVPFAGGCAYGLPRGVILATDLRVIAQREEELARRRR